MNIENTRDQLREARAALNAARETGIRLSNDEHATVEAMARAMSDVQRAKSRVELLEDSLREMQDAQSRAERMRAAQAEDRVLGAAKAFHSKADFFKCVANVRTNPDARLMEYAAVKDSASGQNLTTDADGGYLVPPDYAQELLVMAQSESVLYPEVRKASVAGNRLIQNSVVSASRGDTTGSAQGRTGLLAFWKGEAAQYDASKMKFAQTETPLQKLTGLVYATDEMLEDAPALSSLISEGFRDEFAFKIDDAILNGTGSGMPYGMLHSSNAALVTIAKESGQAAKSIVMANLLKMHNALPANMRMRARWYINQDLEPVLMQMTMETGSMSSETVTAVFGAPVFLPGRTIAEAPNGMLLGVPIQPVEQCSALGTLGDIGLLVPDAYRWIEKGGVKAATSLHVRFDYDETAFKFTYRAGGRPMWTNAITAYKGGSTRSPYIALADRA